MIKAGSVVLHYPAGLEPVIGQVNYENNSLGKETVWTIDFVLDSRAAEFLFEVKQ